jgi:hypothetical protein
MSDTIVRTRRGISKKAATSHVHRNLVKHPRQRGWEPWNGYDLDSLENFTTSAKAWLGDKSELSAATLDAADYAEILGHFREMAGWKPKDPVKPKTVAAAKRLPRVITTRIVPGNWRYMADHADTEAARAWWSNYCDKRMRGEV